ncbi:hypothetical protein EV361DRAFT_929154 [Lentinula raphanica]|nr:hypothetical protein EV361DRAFT_929154 [Lentinula raphanica]
MQDVVNSRRTVSKATVSRHSLSPLSDLDEGPDSKTVTERRTRRASKANGKEKMPQSEDESRTSFSSSRKSTGKRTSQKAQGQRKEEPESGTESSLESEMEPQEESESEEDANEGKNAVTRIVPPSKRSDWPEGSVEYYCHQCRNKSFRLFMGCSSRGCKAKYCNRCVITRYADVVSFDSERKNFECFRCQEICSCDQCCRKRGETYIPFSQVLKASVSAPSATHRSSNAPSKALPTLTIDTEISEPVLYWGAVYNRAGEEIASAYVPTSADDDDVLFARPNPLGSA